ncbi:MAG TPA: VOC family protein [Devosia sp.]
MSIRSIDVLSVPVSDPARSLEFYVDTLGFELERDDQSVPGMRWVTVRPRGSRLKVTLVTWFETMPAGSLRGLVLASDNIATEFRRLSDAGVEFVQSPVERPWGIEAVFRDPDGNELVLQQSSPDA